MSTKTPASVPPSTGGISKSAAKKRAKKAARAASTQVDLPPAPAGEIPSEGPDLFNLPLGSYQPEFNYDTGEFYDDPPIPQLSQNANSPFSLPFPFDYSSFNGQQPNSFGGLAGGFNITDADLEQTTEELHRRMGDPNFGSEDPYWSSLPPHLRQFIREAVPYSGNLAAGQKGGGGAGGDAHQGMWAMAQQIVSAASQGMGLGPNTGANLFAGVNGGRGLGDELGFHRHPDAKDEELDEDDEFDLDDPNYVTAPNGDIPKSKKKNKKKKKSSAVDPPPAPTPVPPVKQPPRPQTQPPTTQPALNPPPPPAPAHPPPSSRAAGKQPMAHAPAANGNTPARSARAAGKAPASNAPAHNHNHNHSHNHSSKPLASKGKAPANTPPVKIWTQASVEDRDNIRHFWLNLNEAERKDLLQIERDSVLRKMKEQSRHSCGCAVCSRKKVNIESELNKLYEQYYKELRLYANEQRAANNGKQPNPPGAGPFPGSVEVDATGQVTKLDHRAPDPRMLARDDLIGDEVSDEYDDDEYEDEDDLDEDDLESEGEDVDGLDDTVPPTQPPPQRTKPAVKPAPAQPENVNDFTAFGQDLATIKGILTVADDLLKNDGAKFADMMEHLAIARSSSDIPSGKSAQRDRPSDSDEDSDPARAAITEAEKIEEGKRMFQIFAARMFEQRVLQAYRERVAKTREEQLLRELEEEDDAKRAKEEKKAKEAQKKKDKKRQQKQRQDEEKAAREAAIAAEQEAAKAKAAAAERERLKKAEEERQRREAVKKAAMEEQAKIAAERRKRQQEEKEREEEAARKRKEREDKARREREAREKEIKEKERREKEAKEKADAQEKERLAKEKAEKERQAKDAREKAEKLKQERLEAEKKAKEEAARVEREAAEQAKVLAAQQAQRERAKAAEKAAAEQQAAAAAATSASRQTPVAPVPVRAKAGSRGAITPPEISASPVKIAATNGPRSGPSQKQPSYPIPVGPAPGRMSIPQPFNNGYRSGAYPSPSPVFSPPGSDGPSTHISPNPPARGFSQDSSPSYDLGPRTAPIGMGYPQAGKRIPSVDEAFSPGVFATSASSSRNVSGEHDQPSAIAPPGPIGRPASYMENIASASSLTGRSSPNVQEKQLGSAALGGDDEIVPSTRRNMSNGWGGDIPIAAAPGSGRWSSAPGTAGASIWGTTSTSTHPTTSDIGAGGSSWGSFSPPISSGQTRQPSFGHAMSSPFSPPTAPIGLNAHTIGSLPVQQPQPPQQHQGFGHSIFAPPGLTNHGLNSGGQHGGQQQQQHHHSYLHQH